MDIWLLDLEDLDNPVALTRRAGAGRRGRISPRELAAELPALAAGNDIAVLFGREESGLTNEELPLMMLLL